VTKKGQGIKTLYMDELTEDSGRERREKEKDTVGWPLTT
jgi:hypothetical protein